MTGSLYRKELKRLRLPFAAAVGAALAWIPAVFLLRPAAGTDPLAFHAACCLRPLMVLGSVGGAALFSRAMSGEWARGTAEFLLAKPGSRTSVLLGKALAGLTVLAAVNAAAYLSGMATLALLAEAEWSLPAFLTLSLYAFLPMPAFGGAALLASLCLPRARSLAALAAAVVLACFLPDALSWMDGSSAAAGLLSGLRWADLDAGTDRPALLRTALPALIAAAAFAGSWAVFLRMDVPEKEKCR